MLGLPNIVLLALSNVFMTFEVAQLPMLAACCLKSSRSSSVASGLV